MGDTYTCAACGATEKRVRTDNEVVDEYDGVYGDRDTSDAVMVCTPCYKLVMAHKAEKESL